MISIPAVRRVLEVLIAFSLASHVRAQPGAKPNELGQVLILEYHLIETGSPRWARTPQQFRQDLTQLYDAGYRTLSMGDYIDGRIALPAGTHPVVITFDDSSPGQFKYISRNGATEIDPDSAVGIMIDFAKRHPDFGKKAIFFVLPGADEPHRLFGQPAFEGDKLRELVSLGFEIGNHTLWHANLGRYNPLTVEKQLALAVQAIQRCVPGYRIRALALPFGAYPKDLNLAVEGNYEGITYRNEAILRVSGGPAQSPFATGCNLLHLPRIQMTGEALRSELRHFRERPGEVFTSDGKTEVVTFPKSLAGEFNGHKFPSLRVAGY